MNGTRVLKDENGRPKDNKINAYHGDDASDFSIRTGGFSCVHPKSGVRDATCDM